LITLLPSFADKNVWNFKIEKSEVPYELQKRKNGIFTINGYASAKSKDIDAETKKTGLLSASKSRIIIESCDEIVTLWTHAGFPFSML
jgi:fumarate hydratase class II